MKYLGSYLIRTVDGNNPAMYETLSIMGIYHINWCRISSINSITGEVVVG